jgi:ubiquinone/menaquinone biosynthesis C-methylase UbiE
MSARARYDRLAPFYDWLEFPLERLVFHRLRRLVWQYARGKILEVGVGTGRNMVFYPAGSEITAIDISPAMLARAERRARKLGRRVELRLMDVEHLTLADATFDTVLATFVFCSVYDPVAGLKEVRRVCRPDGQVVLLEHVRSDHPPWGKLMDWLNPLAVGLLGDNINRRTVDNVERAGLTLKQVEDVAGPLVKLIVATP